MRDEVSSPLRRRESEKSKSREQTREKDNSPTCSLSMSQRNLGRYFIVHTSSRCRVPFLPPVQNERPAERQSEEISTCSTSGWKRQRQLTDSLSIEHLRYAPRNPLVLELDPSFGELVLLVLLSLVATLLGRLSSRGVGICEEVERSGDVVSELLLQEFKIV